LNQSNMSDQDIRWKQRFQNFEKAFNQLTSAVEKKKLSDLEKAGCIQFYEFTFELAWKTLNDYLKSQKVDVKFPRDTIKEAFRYELIDDGDLWMDMLEKRNLMSHTYDETSADLAYGLISGSYYKALKTVYQKLKSIQ
jgi:nucleotidyltransferase substrate binding protein (TIGR01987 family)